MRPVSLSISYLLCEPRGVSTMTLISSGFFLPGEMSCHRFIFHECKKYRGHCQLEKTIHRRQAQVSLLPVILIEYEAPPPHSGRKKPYRDCGGTRSSLFLILWRRFFFESKTGVGRKWRQCVRFCLEQQHRVDKFQLHRHSG